MTITLTQHGVTHSIETKQELFDATEALEMFTNLMKCAGWAQVSVDNAIMELYQAIDL
tara:strand:- start:93 stop:266 length:174 start_codon:yes stop_codon:yes gene_type:complete